MKPLTTVATQTFIASKIKGHTKVASSCRTPKTLRVKTTMHEHFAICLNNAEYPAALERHKIYRVLTDEDAAADGELRIIDESGEDYLYPAAWFAFVEVPQAVETSLLQAA